MAKFKKVSSGVDNKLMIILSLLMFVSILGGIFIVNRKNNIENFNVNDKKLYYFYMEGCGHCVEFNDIWDKILKNHKDSKVEFVKANIADSEVAKELKVNSAPTIYAKNGEKFIEFVGSRNESSIATFIANNLS